MVPSHGTSFTDTWPHLLSLRRQIGQFSNTTLPNGDTESHVRQELRSCNKAVMFCSPQVSGLCGWLRPLFINLRAAGEPTRVGLVPTIARARNPTYSNTPSSVSGRSNPPKPKFGMLTGTSLPLQEPLYNARGRVRDGRCLITGLQGQTYSRLKVTHIFPRTHGTEVSSLVAATTP